MKVRGLFPQVLVQSVAQYRVVTCVGAVGGRRITPALVEEVRRWERVERHDVYAKAVTWTPFTRCTACSKLVIEQGAIVTKLPTSPVPGPLQRTKHDDVHSIDMANVTDEEKA